MRGRALLGGALGVLLLGIASVGIYLALSGNGNDNPGIVPGAVSNGTAPADGGEAAPAGEQKTATLSRLIVPRVSIDAPMVTMGVDSGGAMQSPANPFDVAWYNFSSLPGQGGNIVLSGHVDFINHGPAVFWRLRELKAGDEIQLKLSDDSVMTYKIASVSRFDADMAPVQQIIGKTAVETITLITCDGTFDRATGDYDQRLVLRATRA